MILSDVKGDIALSTGQTSLTSTSSASPILLHRARNMDIWAEFSSRRRATNCLCANEEESVKYRSLFNFGGDWPSWKFC